MGEAEDSLIKASNLPLNIKQTSEPPLAPKIASAAGLRFCSSAPLHPRARPSPSPPLLPVEPGPVPSRGQPPLAAAGGWNGFGAQPRGGRIVRGDPPEGPQGARGAGQAAASRHPPLGAGFGPFCHPLGKARTKHVRRWFPGLCPED